MAIKKKYTYALLLVIAVIYGLTAVNSTGYHHPDEHYQIIEFAGLKDGWNYDFDLTWEYDAQIRPALQPMIALCVFKLLGLFGVNDPFHLMLGLRILTAILALFCITFFIRHFRAKLKPEYFTVFLFLSLLLWFLPAINVRFSSETWAGLMLMPAIVFLDRETGKSPSGYLLAGILLGLSLEFRFQMGIAIFSLLLWLVLIKKEKLLHVMYVFVGGTLVVAGCTLLDCWYYNDIIIVPWNYFKSNIIDGIASNFGVSPWYYYLSEIVTRPIPLLGILIFISIVLCCFVGHKNIVVWCIVPFIVIHSFIPHKELRFLFPIVNFIPLIVVMAFQYVLTKWKFNDIRIILYFLLAIIFVINAGGLAMLCFKPAMYGKVEMVEYLSKRKNNTAEMTNVYTIAYSNPYTEGTAKGLTARFYTNNNIVLCNLQDVLYSKEKISLQNNDLVILMAGYHEHEYIEDLGFEVEHRSIPLWIAKMNIFYNVYPIYNTLLLYSKPK